MGQCDRQLRMREVKCNLCGADDYTVRFPKGVAQLHRIVQCNRCGLMYANPQELVDCECFDVRPATRRFWTKLINACYFQKQQVQLPDNEQRAAHVERVVPHSVADCWRSAAIAAFFSTASGPTAGQATGLEPDRAVADYSAVEIPTRHHRRYFAQSSSAGPRV